MVENIRACISAINGLSVEKLNGMDNNGIDKELFGFITINADIQIRDKIVQWYGYVALDMGSIGELLEPIGHNA